MVNSNYVKGVRKERKIVNEYRDKGCIAFRSAGSHSPIDVVVIDLYHKHIMFFQCKPDSMSVTNKNKLNTQYANLNDSYEVSYEVV